MVALQTYIGVLTCKDTTTVRSDLTQSSAAAGSRKQASLPRKTTVPTQDGGSVFSFSAPLFEWIHALLHSGVLSGTTFPIPSIPFSSFTRRRRLVTAVTVGERGGRGVFFVIALFWGEFGLFFYTSSDRAISQHDGPLFSQDTSCSTSDSFAGSTFGYKFGGQRTALTF